MCSPGSLVVFRSWKCAYRCLGSIAAEYGYAGLYDSQKKAIQENGGFQPDRLAQPARSCRMSAPTSAPTILIVDDTEVNLLLLQSVLDAEGFRTLTAPDGATARALSRAQIPDLILLDVVMPGESGF